jgi:hypothetical protein
VVHLVLTVLFGSGLYAVLLARGCSFVKTVTDDLKAANDKLGEVASKKQVEELAKATNDNRERLASISDQMARMARTPEREPSPRIALISPPVGERSKWNDADVKRWLTEARREPGPQGASHRYEIVGKIAEPRKGATVIADVLGGRGSPNPAPVEVAPDGTFKASIWLDDSLPPVKVRLRLREGKDVTPRQFAVER